MPRMIQKILCIFAIVFGCSVASAQDEGMTFSDDDMSSSSSDSGGDEGGMTFGEIDTEKEAKKVERSKQAELDLIRVLQRRPFLKRRRLEFAPMAGTNINDPLINAFFLGGSLTYHLTEVMAIGVTGTYAIGDQTDLYTDVIGDYDVFPEISQIIWDASLDFQYEFLYGKFALFNTWIIPWSTYALLGAGVTQTELDTNATITVGVGQRYFMNRWFTFNLMLRDGIYQEEYPGGSELVNNLVFLAGVSFFIPPNFKYRTLK